MHLPTASVIQSHHNTLLLETPNVVFYSLLCPGFSDELFFLRTLKSIFLINLSFPECILHLKHTPFKKKLMKRGKEYRALNSPILSCPLSFNISYSQCCIMFSNNIEVARDQTSRPQKSTDINFSIFQTPAPR
jgi:hypothetical protein